MYKVKEFINKIKGLTSLDRDVNIVLDELNEFIKDVLRRRVRELNIRYECKQWANLIVENWRYPLRWKIRSTPAVTTKNENNECHIMVAENQQLLIFNDADDIKAGIDSIINSIQKQCASKYMKCDEMILLRRLHELYKSFPGEDGEDVKKVITKSFNVKYVACEDNYKRVDYFESYESDVAETETRFGAMVSLFDDSCINKGIYLYPQKNN